MTKIINLQSFLVLLAFLAILITFDAAQQQFYVQSFSLSGSNLSFSTFISLHAIRWFNWLVFSIPYIFFIWNIPNLEKVVTSTKAILKILATSGVIISATVLSISIVSIYQQEVTLDLTVLVEFSQFFLFQKGLAFFLAHIGLLLWLVNVKQKQRIEDQWKEIEILKNDTTHPTSLTNDLIVKNGDLQERLSVKEVVWVQADDYCVRVHTHDKSYYLRKSMKFLEEQLTPLGFVRIHRSALLNINHLKRINYSDSKVILRNEFELPVSKSGKSVLKKHLKETVV